MDQAAAASILLATVAALYLRPFGARDWHVAATGAIAAWIAGPLSFDDGLEVARESWNILAFFLGLMLLAAGAEASGIYRRAAALLGHPGRQSLVRVILGGAVITAILSNDATPLILTPAVLATHAAVQARAPLLGVTFVADGASLLLPFSNPVNLLFVERFDIELDWYLIHVTLSAFAGLASLAAVAMWQSRPALPGSALQRIDETWSASELFALAIVCALVIAYVVAGIFELPLGAITLAAGTLLVAGELALDRTKAAAIRSKVSPGVLVFVLGLLIIVEAVSEAGVLAWLEEMLRALDGSPTLLAIAGAAALSMVLSNLLNNWPAAIIVAAAVEQAGSGEALIAGCLIGCTIGANLTLLGSLSTVFWLTLTRQQGVTFTAGEYLQASLAPTLTGVLVASAAAALLLPVR